MWEREEQAYALTPSHVGAGPLVATTVSTEAHQPTLFVGKMLVCCFLTGATRIAPHHHTTILFSSLGIVTRAPQHVTRLQQATSGTNPHRHCTGYRSNRSTCCCLSITAVAMNLEKICRHSAPSNLPHDPDAVHA